MTTIPTINPVEQSAAMKVVISLTRENEHLRDSLRELIDVIRNQLISRPWIETLHKVQTAEVLLGEVTPFDDDPHKMSAEEVIGDTQ